MIDPNRPLIVAGCSRSGTTALVELLNSHPKAVIGMERFKYLYFQRKPGVLAEIFTPTRFIDFREGDTNITPEGGRRWEEFYDSLARKLQGGEADVIGDKALASPGVVRFISNEYPEARWIFIFRDVVAVAGSYVRRAENEDDVNWPETKRHKEALGDWTRAFEAIDDLALAVGSERVFPLSYESLFGGDTYVLEALCHFMGTDLPDEMTKAFSAMTSGWERRRAKPSPLTETEKNWLASSRPLALEDRFQSLADEAVAIWSP